VCVCVELSSVGQIVAVGGDGEDFSHCASSNRW